jgi:hypothetical protein
VFDSATAQVFDECQLDYAFQICRVERTFNVLGFFEMPSASVHESVDVVAIFFVIGPGFPAEDLNRYKTGSC